MILIIACGNSLRGDDGAGLLLAETLETRITGLGYEVEQLRMHQLTPELASDIAHPAITAVLFVDTRVAVTDAEEVRVESLGEAAPAPAPLGHNLDARTVLAYAGLLVDDRPLPPAWLVTIPGWEFEHGEHLSQASYASLMRAETAQGPLSGLLAYLAG